MTAMFCARADEGFSLVELVVSTALVLLTLAALFGAMHPAYGAFRAAPETMDAQQRLRVVIDLLSKEVSSAGGGVQQGPHAGPLNDWFAAVLPLRQGRRNADPPGTYKTDTITIVHVNSGAAQTTIAVPLPARTGTVQVALDAGCSPGDPVCGFRAGMSVLVFDDTGSYDLFTITSIQGNTLSLDHDMPDSGKIYAPAISRIVEASSRTYYLKADLANDMYRLERYDGAGGADVPVVDHLVALRFAYLADPQPPVAIKSPIDPAGPWTTYGPKAPASGDNCIFAAGAPLPLSRLPVLNGGAPDLVPLTAADLTDGPWCPTATAPNRFDADLLRVRSIVVTARVEAGSRALRGPAGILFARGGTSRDGAFVPDQEVTFEIAPKNLSLRR
jgi:hypothetical protein